MVVPMSIAATEVPSPHVNGGHGTTGRRALSGLKGFVRYNPLSDLFDVKEFDHVEFWCGDALNTSKRFGFGLGMNLVAKSDQSTENYHFASYVMKNRNIVMAFTAPYSGRLSETMESKPPVPYTQSLARDFFISHGIGVRAVGIRVADASVAFAACVENGGVPVQEPLTMTGEDGSSSMVIAEVQLYGDVVLRYVSGTYQGPFLPGYVATTTSTTTSSTSSSDILDTTTTTTSNNNNNNNNNSTALLLLDYGLDRFDHAVGNVPDLITARDYIMKCTGFHEFAEFVAEDVGTVDSGLNSVVLASNNEMVLLPVNEPTFDTPRKSQIQTYLEQNGGPGVQHLALKTENIFNTMTKMRMMTAYGGFEFMPKPSKEYYDNLPEKIGPYLTSKQYKMCEELGLLVDRDDQGVLLQIFTKPVGDRSTFFFEIIQRICTDSSGDVVDQDVAACGGFGKGNFTELFKSIEVYETQLGIN
jgi:4-hydroxyphenylpyruvate dioxygenase